MHEVVLEGGPADLPQRYVLTQRDAPKVVVHRLNGYEHFEATPAHKTRDGRELQVYRWSYRTAIAE
ncbi:DUF5988 family protein [Actinomadura rugatobispora]|uniref:DUF5988 family protein n=1 Tax=Actinomadura rugatobispora TaxID=1994 RepID=A0ABW0ZXI1_9ACTN|nr:hypothetical protein GCM10010200_091720 [Actinomadura rugatobispora]